MLRSWSMVPRAFTTQLWFMHDVAVHQAYLRILLLPTGLNALYYTPYIERLGFQTFFATLVLAALAALLWRWGSRSGDKNIVFAELWLPVTLLPVLYLPAFSEGDFVRDRYIYMPSIGFVFLLATAIRHLPSMRRISASALQGGVALILVLVLTTGCLAQANDILLFYRGQSLNPESVYAATSLGQALERHGYYGRAANILEGVTNRAPAAGPAYYVLASAYVHLNRPEDARAALARAIAIFPAYAADQAGMNDVAAIYGGLGEYDRALQMYTEVLRKQPDYYLALYNAGYTLFRMERLDEAERYLRHALREASDLAPPNFYLGRVLLARQNPEAETYLRRAVQLTPNGYEYHYWLGQALESQAKMDAAREEYRNELRLDPSSQNAKLRLVAIGN